MKTLYFLWSGFPDYAARCVRRLISKGVCRVEVIATRPAVPIEGMERSLGQPVHWIDGGDGHLSWSQLALPLPDLLVQGGYAWPAFRALGDACRQQKVPVVLASDHRWSGSFRQLFVEPLRYRWMMQSKFAAVLVPGRSGRQFYQHMGVPEQQIVEGLYGADPDCFRSEESLAARTKRFLFVGQLHPRKNVLGLCEAFIAARAELPGWRLTICGAGPQRDALPSHDGIEVREFLQPQRLAGLMRDSRALVLPSLSENWGLVVHEASLSGCAMILSRAVGAATDLASAHNALMMAPGSTEALRDALVAMARWTDEDWRTAQAASLSASESFGPDRFAQSVVQLLRELIRD